MCESASEYRKSDPFVWGTQRGLSANSDTRAEILDLIAQIAQVAQVAQVAQIAQIAQIAQVAQVAQIAQMEAKTPIPEPNQGAGLNQLGGTWRLVYTSNSELVPILALGRLPLVEVGDITQTIDAASGKVENVVSLSVPFSKTSVGSTIQRSDALLTLVMTSIGIDDRIESLSCNKGLDLYSIPHQRS